MNALIKSSLIALAAAVPVTFMFQPLDFSFIGQNITEVAFAAFASASLVLTSFADYAYRRRPGRSFIAKHAVLTAAKRQLDGPSVQLQRRRAPSLTGIR